MVGDDKRNDLAGNLLLAVFSSDRPFLVRVSNHAIPQLDGGAVDSAAAADIQALAAGPEDLPWEDVLEIPLLATVSRLTVPNLQSGAIDCPAADHIQALVIVHPNDLPIVETPLLANVPGLAIPHLDDGAVGIRTAADIQALAANSYDLCRVTVAAGGKTNAHAQA
jgi:hypothetical protein